MCRLSKVYGKDTFGQKLNKMNVKLSLVLIVKVLCSNYHHHHTVEVEVFEESKLLDVTIIAQHETISFLSRRFCLCRGWLEFNFLNLIKLSKDGL